MNFKPTLNKVLVKPNDPVTQIGLITVPTSTSEKHVYGTIVSVGPGNYTDKGEFVPVGLKEGNQVVFLKTAATEIKLDGNDYLILKETDIIGIID